MVEDFMSVGQELGRLLTKSAYNSISGKKQTKTIKVAYALGFTVQLFQVADKMRDSINASEYKNELTANIRRNLKLFGVLQK